MNIDATRHRLRTRQLGNATAFAVFFPALAAATYLVWVNVPTEVLGRILIAWGLLALAIGLGGTAAGLFTEILRDAIAARCPNCGGRSHFLYHGEMLVPKRPIVYQCQDCGYQEELQQTYFEDWPQENDGDGHCGGGSGGGG
jgi:hypothetical protein